jgi:kinetochore protein Spc25
LKDKVTSVESDIEQYRAVVQNLRRGLSSDLFYRLLLTLARVEKNKERSTLNSHAAHLSPELRSCEHRLACTIEGVQADRLLIRFFGLDPTDPERDASFVLDMSSQNYKGTRLLLRHLGLINFCPLIVITASPHLPSMAILVNALNETRDIFAFMRNVRTAYKPLVSFNVHSQASPCVQQKQLLNERPSSQ